jgi:hypothetical protein
VAGNHVTSCKVGSLRIASIGLPATHPVVDDAGSVRTARELLSLRTAVCVPMPPPTRRWRCTPAVQEVAEPVLRQAADLAVQAVTAPGLTSRSWLASI